MFKKKNKIFISGVFIKYNSENWLNILALIISALIGLIAAGIVYKFEKLGFFCLGCFGGILLGMLLYSSVFRLLEI